MRIHTPGIHRESDAFTFDFEGTPVTAFAGESVAAALVSAKQWHWRETRAGETRGLFCGMGVCGECTVSVDGIARRACLEMAKPGLSVTRQPARRSVADSAETPPEREWETVVTDVLVVGAGPAGMAAAAAAARAGASVTVVDERAKAGGQYFKQPGDGFDIAEAQLDHQFQEGRQLYHDASVAGVRFIFGATVWGAFTPNEIAVVTQDSCMMIQPRRLILSPGAYERPLPFPGWTLPGVMTTGAAQTLLRAYQTAPGQRVLIAGNGPLNLQVARELSSAGVDVVAVAELARRPGPSLAGPLLRMLRNGPGLVADGVGHLAALTRRRVRVMHRHVISRAEGEGKVSRASISRVDKEGRPVPGSEISFDVDAVCMGYGFLPQSELARALQCRHSYDAASGVLTIQRSLDGRTSVEDVFVAGDAGGLGGAKVAQAQGTLAGAAAAADLGLDADSVHGVASARTLALRHLRFQTALWQVYAAPDMGLALTAADTIVCRCESVQRNTLAACFASGVAGIGAVKRETRAGMGRCQGRYCSAMLAKMASEAGFEIAAEGELFAPRTPFKPMPIGSLATAYDASKPPDREAEAR